MDMQNFLQRWFTLLLQAIRTFCQAFRASLRSGEVDGNAELNRVERQVEEVVGHLLQVEHDRR